MSKMQYYQPITIVGSRINIKSKFTYLNSRKPNQNQGWVSKPFQLILHANLLTLKGGSKNQIPWI